MGVGLELENPNALKTMAFKGLKTDLLLCFSDQQTATEDPRFTLKPHAEEC